MSDGRFRGCVSEIGGSVLSPLYRKAFQIEVLTVSPPRQDLSSRVPQLRSFCQQVENFKLNELGFP